MKKKLKRFFLTFLLLAIVLPSGVAVALFGVGDSGDALLTAILAEILLHTMALEDVFQGIDYLDRHVSDMRRNYDDPLELETEGLHECL